MADEIQNKLLQLVNEKNDLYRDVTFDNIVMGLPHQAAESHVTDVSGLHSWIAPEDGDYLFVVSGAGGGGAAANKLYPYRSGDGGDGAKETRVITVTKGTEYYFYVGKGGLGGSAPTGKGQPGGISWVGPNSTSSTAIITAQAGDGGEGNVGQTGGKGTNGTPLGGSKGGSGILPTGEPEDFWVRSSQATGEDGYVSITYLTPGLQEGGLERNTSVSLTGILNQGYRGTTDVFYRRHDLTSLFVDEAPVVFRTRDVAFESILNKLNLLYGTALKIEDVASLDSFPTWDEGELEVAKSWELVVKDTSYGWTGAVTIEILNGNPLLESTIVVQLLPLLSHPDEPQELNGKQSGKLMTWMFDFTPWKEELVLNPDNQQWANFARIQEIGREAAGLDYWYNNRVVDLPTSAVPHANPRFERVKVQSFAGGGVVGPLYFHYDENW